MHLAGNSDGFVFDSEIIAQGVWQDLQIQEVPIEAHYFPEASQIGFWPSVHYGFSVLKVLARYKMQEKGLLESHIFTAGPAAHPSPSSR